MYWAEIGLWRYARPETQRRRTQTTVCSYFKLVFTYYRVLQTRAVPGTRTYTARQPRHEMRTCARQRVARPQSRAAECYVLLQSSEVYFTPVAVLQWQCPWSGSVQLAGTSYKNSVRRAQPRKSEYSAVFAGDRALWARLQDWRIGRAMRQHHGSMDT